LFPFNFPVSDVFLSVSAIRRIHPVSPGRIGRLPMKSEQRQRVESARVEASVKQVRLAPGLLKLDAGVPVR
jgi:hypothetical protein